MNSARKHKRRQQYFGRGADRSIWGQKRVVQYIHVREDQKPGPVTIIKPNP